MQSVRVGALALQYMDMSYVRPRPMAAAPVAGSKRLQRLALRTFGWKLANSSVFVVSGQLTIFAAPLLAQRFASEAAEAEGHSAQPSALKT